MNDNERLLRAALTAFCEAFENRGETTSLKEWNGRLKLANDSAREALVGREPYSEPKPENSSPINRLPTREE